MIDFNVIHKDSPSAMLEDCIRLFIEGGCSMADGVQREGSRYVKCELDGEPVAGVCYASIELDQDGDPCLMLFTDETLAAHVAGGTGVPIMRAVAVRSRRVQKNN